jgi:hypothetical protein
MDLVILDGCPCPASIAPYIARVLRRAGQSANSIYRGEDAKALLHAHGKSTQAEIHRLLPAISNPPGFSSHELRGDGVCGPRGKPIPGWKVGVDSGTDSPASRDAITRAARELGYVVEHPYSRGVEAHHWNFAKRPRPRNPVQFAHIVAERRRMPTR